MSNSRLTTGHITVSPDYEVIGRHRPVNQPAEGEVA